MRLRLGTVDGVLIALNRRGLQSVCVALHARSLATLESARGLRDDALFILSERNWIGMGNPAMSAARRGLQSVCVALHARSLAALESTRGLRDDAFLR